MTSDHIVQFVEVAVGGHFSMQGNHQVACAVFVDDEATRAAAVCILLPIHLSRSVLPLANPSAPVSDVFALSSPLSFLVCYHILGGKEYKQYSQDLA